MTAHSKSRAPFLAVMVLVLIVPVVHAAPDRYALVVGNATYHLGALENPVNDANLMARTLREAGFQVDIRTDLNQIEMKKAIRDFGEKLSAAEPESVGLFYFAGHGLQVQGTNYLVPVGAGAKIRREPDVDIEAVSANSILSVMEYAGNRLNIVVLDACRNNPFHRGFRSMSHGLARMDAPTGSIIAYATAPGSVAEDGIDQHGTYTQELVRAMRTPGRSIEEVFKKTRMSVIEMTGGRQVPWESSSLIGEFHFFAPGNAAPGHETGTTATDAWVEIADTVDRAALINFIDQYPNSPLASLARKRLAHLSYNAERTPSPDAAPRPSSDAKPQPPRPASQAAGPAAPAPPSSGGMTRQQMQAELNRQLQAGARGVGPAPSTSARTGPSAPTLVDPNTGTVLSDQQAAALVAGCNRLSSLLRSAPIAGQARSAAMGAQINQLRSKCESYGIVTY